MSDQSEPRELNAASTEQVLETKDLEVKITGEEADQVRGGDTATAKRGKAIEISDWGFEVTTPLTTSR